MFRTRFSRDIVTEFLPPARSAKIQRAIVLCDGMPSIPRKQPLAEFLSQKGYWVFYPRYRGAWESGGEFLARSPHLDVLDVIGGLNKEFRELAFGRRFRVRADEVFVIGGSFGGAAAILSTLDPRVKRAVARTSGSSASTPRRAASASDGGHAGLASRSVCDRTCGTARRCFASSWRTWSATSGRPGSSSWARSYSVMSSEPGSLAPAVQAAWLRSVSYGLMPTYGGGISSEYARSGKRDTPCASRASDSMSDQPVRALI